MSYMMIASAVIGMGTGIGSAYLEWDAKDDALEALGDALAKLKPIPIDEVKDLAADTDIERYKRQFELQREIDPAFAELRERGADNVLRALQEDSSGQSIADRSLKTISGDLEKEHGSTQSLIDRLIDRAKEDLDAGATLPPEFQAELVKAGLENAGNQGYNLDGRGTAGSDIRRLLGQEGIQLQQLRDNSARANIGGAEALRARRAAVLGELAQLDNNLRGAKVIRAGGAAQMGSGAMPAVGLTGADAANMRLQNLNQQNFKIMARGGLRAQGELARGEMWTKMLNSGSSGLTSMMGGMGGGGAGGAAGGAGGGMGGIGSMMGMMGGGGGSSVQGAQQGMNLGLGSWIGGLFSSNSTGGVPANVNGYQVGNLGGYAPVSTVGSLGGSPNTQFIRSFSTY